MYLAVPFIFSSFIATTSFFDFRFFFFWIRLQRWVFNGKNRPMDLFHFWAIISCYLCSTALTWAYLCLCSHFSFPFINMSSRVHSMVIFHWFLKWNPFSEMYPRVCIVCLERHLVTFGVQGVSFSDVLRPGFRGVCLGCSPAPPFPGPGVTRSVLDGLHVFWAFPHLPFTLRSGRCSPNFLPYH